MEERNEIVLSPKIFLEVLSKNLVFIVITCLLFSLASFFVTKFFIQKQYTTKLSLYVDTTIPEDKTNPAYSLSLQTYAQKLVSTYIKMLDTTSFYTKVSEKINEKYKPSQLSSMISFKSDENTEVFDVYICSTSPTEAKLIGDAVAEVAPQVIAELRSNADLKICDPAQTPNKHSYPNMMQNVLVAFVMGLALSLGIAFIRYFADKKIKYHDDMVEIFDIPILATIPNFNDYVNQKKK